MRKIILSISAMMMVSGAVAQQSGSSILGRAQDLFDHREYGAAQKVLLLDGFGSDLQDSREVKQREYLEAMCALYLNQVDGERLVQELIDNSYGKDPKIVIARFALANYLHKEGRYSEAVDIFSQLNASMIQPYMVDEFHFKYAHALFNRAKDSAAKEQFEMVNKSGKYGVYAKYYLSYLDYVAGDYKSALEGFESIASAPQYNEIIPYYLLHLEYLLNNYDYVVDNGDKLLLGVEGERSSEIVKMIGESWFQQGDYLKALDYMARYIKAKGEMGRYENYLVGFSNYKIHNYKAAVDYLKKSVGSDDELSQNASYHLASAHLKLDDKRSAMVSFSLASNGKFNKVIAEDALYNYGKLQYEIGGGVFNEAINALQRYLDTYPNSSRVENVKEFLISAYYNSKNYEAAYEAIKQVKNPDNNIKAAYQKISYFRALDHYNNGEYDKAMDMFNQSLQNNYNPKYTALAAYWQGEINYRNGKFSEAIPYYKRYQLLAPQNEREHVMANYNLAYCYFNASDWNGVKSYTTRFLSNYIKQDSYRADALNRLGDALFSDREYSKAVMTYKNAARIGVKESYYSKYQQAIAEGVLGQRSTKINLLKDIISANQGDYIDDAMYELGKTYLAVQNYKEGVKALEIFIAQYPNSPQYISALSEMGLAYQNLGDDKNASKYYKMVVQGAPHTAMSKDAMVGLRGIYIDQNDVDGYFDFATKSGMGGDVTVSQQDSLTFVAAERLYLAKDKRAEEALKSYKGKYASGIFVSDALYYIADCRVKAGDKDGAITQLQELTSMYNNNYTVKGLECLSDLAFGMAKYDISSDAYKKLSEAETSPSNISTALNGYLKSILAQKLPAKDRIDAVKYIISSLSASKDLLAQAKYVNAKALEELGSRDEALKIYVDLAKDPTIVYGAEASYILIEDKFKAGKLDEAELDIFKLSESNTSHNYWLGKSFLMLGDIYIAKEDIFQARATLQSIVDGYSNTTDGIIDSAKEKIKGLE